MKVLVTGGAGFLGRHFVQAHLADHDQVTSIDDFSGTDIATVPQDVLDVTERWDVIEWFRDAGDGFADFGAVHRCRPGGSALSRPLKTTDRAREPKAN